MKKPINSEKIKNSDIAVKTSLSDSGLLLCLVEMLADRRIDTGYCFEKVPVGWQAIETSSIEAYVNGDTILSREADTVNASFTSSFIFTCSKIKGQNHYFNWLCSLS
jgi:hypothetical protein